MTFDDQTDPYDPELAERFRVLDQLAPPPPPPAAAPLAPRTAMGSPRPSTVEVLPTTPPGAARWRRTALLGAAAAVVVAAGLAVFASGGGDGDPGVGAVEAGPAAGSDDVDDGADASAAATDDEAAEDGATDDEGTGSDRADGSSSEAITVEVPGDGDDDGANTDGSDEADGATSTTTNSVPGSSAPSETTATTATTTTTGDDGGDDGDPGDSDELIPKDPTVPDRPTGSIIVPGDGQLVTVAGIVTEVFLDCQSWMVLNEDGDAEHRGGISCDGGSYIVVDGTRIQTSSGFVSADMAFDQHPVELQPGTFVTVTAVKGPFGGLTLDCSRCGVRR